MSNKKVVLACTVCKSKNYYTTKTGDERLVVQKFCPKCNRKTEHKEEK